MSRPAAAMNAGQTNRRFILLAIVLGLIGAILVYVAFSREGGGTGGSASGSQVPVVVAKVDIAARAKITSSMIEVKLVNPNDASSLAYGDTSDVLNKVTRYPISANEQVLATKVVDAVGTTGSSKSLSYTIPKGKRAIAINVKQVVAAGGLIIPGDRVDILVVYDIEFQSDPKEPASREKADAFLVNTLYQDKEVLAVSQIVVDTVAAESDDPNGHRARNSEAKPDPEAVTVTLALTPEEAQKVYLAELNGTIRLSLRPFDDDEGERPLDPIFETDLWPRSLPNPFIR